MLVEAAQATIDTPVEGRLLDDDLEELMDDALDELDDAWEDLEDWGGEVWEDLEDWDLDWDGATTVTATAVTAMVIFATIWDMLRSREQQTRNFYDLQISWYQKYIQWNQA